MKRKIVFAASFLMLSLILSFTTANAMIMICWTAGGETVCVVLTEIPDCDHFEINPALPNGTCTNLSTWQPNSPGWTTWSQVIGGTTYWYATKNGKNTILGTS